MAQGLLTDLVDKIRQLDGKTYHHYKALRGSWSTETYTLHIDHTARSPESSPSRLRLSVPALHHHLPSDWLTDPLTTVPLSDWIHRRFHGILKKISRHRGPGKSGIFYCEKPGPEILPRTSVQLDSSQIVLNMGYGLPAAGNRIDGESLIAMINKALPRIHSFCMDYREFPSEDLIPFIHCYQDQEALRDQLSSRGLIAFIPDGAILPRVSPDDTKPLSDARPLKTPESLRIRLKRPNLGNIEGLGFQEGITVITGAGFHGKSTLLAALKMGIFNHIPGDGREYTVSLTDTVQINVEDGRYASGVNISPYLHNLPLSKSSTSFQSDWCSGSTSQACSVMESLRMGGRSLLFDEDTSAINFLAGDSIIDSLIGDAHNTLQPFLQTAKDLHQRRNVSMICVAGGHRAFLAYADKVILLQDFQPQDVTQAAHKALAHNSESSFPKKPFPLDSIASKRMLPRGSLTIRKRKRPLQVQVLSRHRLQIGNLILDLHDNTQIVTTSQARTILACILALEDQAFNKRLDLEQGIQWVTNQMNLQKLAKFYPHQGELAAVRPMDVAHAINRFRFVKIQAPSNGSE